jgi:imidazole glycerol-phosphate synthase subunit HisH
VTRIAVVDYGAGNLVSISQGLEAARASVAFVADGDAGFDADAIVVPGVGAAAPAMERLRERGLVEPIREWIRAERPYLGICLGLQLLFEGSDEDGAETLGVLPGRTELLRDAPSLPHIGWNQVHLRGGHPGSHRLFDGIPDGADFYFVHSYAGRLSGERAAELTLAETVHGKPFTSAAGVGKLVGVQFHPERSGALGLRMLANFVALAASARSRPGASVVEPVAQSAG